MGLVCWRCGASLKDIPIPFARLEQCRQCHADLHVCRMCRFYNPRMHDKCDHEMAEPAREVDLANFCQYYKPSPEAFDKTGKSNADQAMEKLKALFGTEDTEANQSSNAEPGSTSSAEDEARKRFDDLFKDS